MFLLDFGGVGVDIEARKGGFMKTLLALLAVVGLFSMPVMAHETNVGPGLVDDSSGHGLEGGVVDDGYNGGVVDDGLHWHN